MTELLAPATGIPRDRWGRPLVVPPGDGKPVPYTRATTFVGCLEDTYALGLWQQRMTAIGLADRPDLLLAAAAHRDDKDRLNEIVEQAKEAAQAHAAATTGTALHALAEQVDRGQAPTVPEAYLADLTAYTAATAAMTHLHIEAFTVVDDLQVGGTPDRVVRYQGGTFIADIKTGSITYGMGKIAMQLAVYSRGVLYDHTTGARTPLPDVDQRNALVIHLPAGKGECTLHWVNIAAGWEAVQLAVQVRAWRARKGLSVPVTP